MLKNIPFKPGVLSDETDRDIGKLGFWKDCDKVRFLEGMPTKIGGWKKRTASLPAFDGVARGITDWRNYDGDVFITFGTHTKLYVYSAGQLYNITPFTGPTTNGTDILTTANGTPNVTVAYTDHGFVVDQWLFIQATSPVGGLTIAGAFQVATTPDANSFTFVFGSNATSTATSGGYTTITEELPTGDIDSDAGDGFGSGLYGVDEYGTPRVAIGALAQARTWSLDSWGSYLVANPRGGPILIWQDDWLSPFQRAGQLSAGSTPTTAEYVFVSPEDRHMIALGAQDYYTALPNPMLVRWSAQEDYTYWVPDNLSRTSGQKQLDMGNTLLCAAKVRGEHLLFTDSSVYSMAFVGPPDTFGFRPLGDNGGLVGPMAVCAFEGVAYWMGDTDFFTYDGVTKVIPCTVNNHVFESFNYAQRAKVHVSVNRKFREIWWYYPSANSTEIDSYVIYNLKEGSWAYGTLARTTALAASDVIKDVVALSPDGYIYNHETGTSADGSAINAYIVSGDVEIDNDGVELMHVGGFVPDIRGFAGSLALTISAKKYPGSTETQTSGPYTITPTTRLVKPRVRGRQVSLRFESTGTSDSWQIGLIRADVTPHGQR